MGQEKNNGLTLLVSLAVLGGLILQFQCFWYANICLTLPSDRGYCNSTKNNETNTTSDTRGKYASQE